MGAPFVKKVMKKANLWIPAAILSCGLWMTSCLDEQKDKPAPDPERHSAIDQGKWWIDESNMDGWYDAFDITDGALYRKPADRIRIW